MPHVSDNPITSSSEKSVNILTISCHPDDIEFGAGGTLAKAVQRGHKVYMLILSDGGCGGDAATRVKEATAAANLLGVSDVFWGGYEDSRLPFYDDVVPTIEKVVNTINPSFAFIHAPGDTHQDHRAASSAAVVATRKVRNVLYFESPTTLDFSPTVFVDIEAVFSRKYDALRCHESQIMRTNIEDRSILEMSKALGIFRGTQCRVKCAEAFSSFRMFVLL